MRGQCRRGLSGGADLPSRQVEGYAFQLSRGCGHDRPPSKSRRQQEKPVPRSMSAGEAWHQPAAPLTEQ